MRRIHRTSVTASKEAIFLAPFTLAVFMYGCGGAAEGSAGAAAPAAPTQSPTPAVVSEGTVDPYTLSVQRAATSQLSPSKLYLPKPSNGVVKVVTWTSWSYTCGKNPALAKPIWVTIVPEVQDTCKQWKDDVKLRLQQLIGLPTSSDDTTFVEMEVKITDMFRPASNPDPMQPEASYAPIDSKAPPDFVLWFANNMTSSYVIPNGYPWTRLGYTYNWDPKATSPYGASEYIVRAGTVVNVTSLTSTTDYCSTGPKACAAQSK